LVSFKSPSLYSNGCTTARRRACHSRAHPSELESGRKLSPSKTLAACGNNTCRLTGSPFSTRLSVNERSLERWDYQPGGVGVGSTAEELEQGPERQLAGLYSEPRYQRSYTSVPGNHATVCRPMFARGDDTPIPEECQGKVAERYGLSFLAVRDTDWTVGHTVEPIRSREV
jgi:hypothetical protein